MDIQNFENYEDAESIEIESEDAETVALDADVISVLNNRKYKGDLKWYQYYRALERYVYRRNPTYEARQFTFDIQVDSVTEEPTFIIRLEENKKKKKPLYIRLLKYTPSLIGPMLGASLMALLRN